MLVRVVTADMGYAKVWMTGRERLRKDRAKLLCNEKGGDKIRDGRANKIKGREVDEKTERIFLVKCRKDLDVLVLTEPRECVCVYL